MKSGAMLLALVAALGVGGLGGAWVASTVIAQRASERHDAMIAGQGPETGNAKKVPDNPLEAGNPLGDGADVVVAGKQLFTQMNCAGCHGYDGSGNMGPKLTDGYWRYGGSPVAIYTTIRDGRPQGMPAWGRLLPPVKLWQLTAYVGSLGGGVPADQALAALHGDVVLAKDKKAQNNAAEGGSALEGQ
jgi:mono/diheme cytochrome c family protein